MALVLTSQQQQSIFEHALQEAPNECCGILVGTASGEHRFVQQVHRLANVWEGDRTHRFMIDAKAHLRLQREARDSLLSIIGFYHSHPQGTPNPSGFDTEMAWPEHSYVIVSLRDGKVDAIKSWLFNEAESRFIEEDIPTI
jgi:proteasome lid subunit RPN8/RPN11